MAAWTCPTPNAWRPGGREREAEEAVCRPDAGSLGHPAVTGEPSGISHLWARPGERADGAQAPGTAMCGTRRAMSPEVRRTNADPNKLNKSAVS